MQQVHDGTAVADESVSEPPAATVELVAQVVYEGLSMWNLPDSLLAKFGTDGAAPRWSELEQSEREWLMQLVQDAVLPFEEEQRPLDPGLRVRVEVS